MVFFFVPGLPQPGGSKKAFVVRSKATGAARATVTEDNVRSKDWRAVVALKAEETIAAPLAGPVVLRVEFRLPRPKRHFGRRGLLPRAPEHHTTKPDTTKLLRSTEDALKGIAWQDDCQVVDQHARKRYCREGEGPGAVIEISLPGAEGEAEVAESPQSQPSHARGEGWLFDPIKGGRWP